jgi:superfamily II DNA or RNA helicase
MPALFDAVRAACSRATWSRGVERVRAGAVTAERVAEEEAVLRVASPDGLLAPTVTLYPLDESWDCDCPSPEDPCEHVAAAVIGLRRAEQEGRTLPSPAEDGAGHLRYCLSRTSGGLALERQVVRGESKTRLEASLAAIASERVRGPRFLAREADLAVERALDSPLPGRLSRGALERLLPALAACEDVRLDGRPVTVSSEAVVPHGHLVDQDGGFRLYVERDPDVTEVLGEGVVLCGDTLRPVRESRLTARELRELPRGRFYPAERVAELVNEVLPELGTRIPLEIHTGRLPGTTRVEPPRVRIETRGEGDALAVRADLVYGDPPTARLEDGRLVHLQGRVPLRDEPAERALARRVHGELALPVGREVVLRDAEAIELADRLGSFEGEVRGTAHRAFFRAPALVPELSLSAKRFDLDFAAGGADLGIAGSRRRADLRSVLAAWESGRSLVPLAGGGLAPLPTEWLARHGRIVRALLESRAPDGELPAFALPDLGRLCEALGAPPPPELGALRALAERVERVPRVPLPTDLRAVLRGYQREGVDWLVLLREAGLGALLADDMGLGKTLQVLCALAGRTLVVTPTSALQNWIDEIQRFRPGLSICRYHGPGRALDEAADVTLTTWAVLRLDAERLAAERWGTAVLDEAQAIKNPDSQVARAAYELRANFRVSVSGTPVENRLDELWSQIHFTNPGLLGSRAAFQDRYARPIAAGEPGVADELRRRIRPFVLRRLKREVAPELPPRTEVVLRCELRESERQVYDAVRAAARRDVALRLEAGGSALAVLEALLRLRQAACHTGLVPGQEARDSSKVALLLEELDTVVADGHKALVFSQWTSLLDRVEPHLRGAGIAFTRLDGATRDRGAVVARFQADDGPPVLLVSLQAGGTALNLTAADHVFLLDPWWNPAVEDQAADRTHRIGQTRPVMVYRLVAADTVEERVLALQQRKRALVDAALGSAGAAPALTRDDLLALLA